MRKKSAFFKLLMIIIFVAGAGLSASAFRRDDEVGKIDKPNRLAITDDGLRMDILSDAQTVNDLLGEQKLDIRADDEVYPDLDIAVSAGMNVIIRRAKEITVVDGNETPKRIVTTTRPTVEEAIWDQHDIDLGDDDITMPDRKTLLRTGMEVKITHVEIKEEVIAKSIDFEVVTKEDDKLGWREKKVFQAGEKGAKEIKYKVVYHDGKEISRKILEQNVVKKPVEQINIQGTYVKTGKAHSGAASWYAHTGTLSAANPWLPMGSYVRVTNRANGKSVIVRINDRGPFGPGRIIDLDKVAFAKIADLGAGVVDVKMEEITN